MARRVGDPPEHAVVLCVDEKTQIQGLDRMQPILRCCPASPNAGPMTDADVPKHFDVHVVVDN